MIASSRLSEFMTPACPRGSRARWGPGTCIIVSEWDACVCAQKHRVVLSCIACVLSLWQLHIQSREEEVAVDPEDFTPHLCRWSTWVVQYKSIILPTRLRFSHISWSLINPPFLLLFQSPNLLRWTLNNATRSSTLVPNLRQPHNLPRSATMADPTGLSPEGAGAGIAEVDACSLEIERNYEIIPAVICSMCCLFGIIYCFFGEAPCPVTGLDLKQAETRDNITQSHHTCQ